MRGISLKITEITPEIEMMAGDAGSGLSKGGMKTKLMAAKTATAAGCAMAICSGYVAHPLKALSEGGKCTWFTAQIDPRAARKRWIGGMKPLGSLTLDDGAVLALGRGKSLLPAGVVATQGEYQRGDPVSIRNGQGTEIGLGLTRYNAREVAAIKGCRSVEIEDLLGYPGRAALIHRDDMAV